MKWIVRRAFRGRLCLLGLALAIAGQLSCRSPETESGDAGPAAGEIDESNKELVWFDERALSVGLDFVHIRATEKRFWFPEIMSGGAAWIDFDSDGDLDAYLVQGGGLGSEDQKGPRNRLYRNDQERFVDVTGRAGVGDTGYGMGVAVGDVDNDQWPDLYVTNLGPNVLYRNQGDGTFEKTKAGVEDDGWSSSASFVDFDADGDLDLYVVNYVSWSPRIEVECFGAGGGRDYCHPNRYQAPAADSLFRNEGEFVFTDVSQSSGIRSAFGNGLGVVTTDIDQDGRIDIYVANDGMPNQLWINQGDGSFVDQAIPLGCSVNISGAAEAGMGVALADLNADRHMDIFLTHLRHETNTLYLNRQGHCDDVTASWGLGAPSLSMTGFGTGFADFDHDGWLDLWVSNGRVTAEGALLTDDPFAEPNQVYRRVSSGRFEELDAETSGVGMPIESARATAFGDFDLDGDVDALVANNGGPVHLFVNQTQKQGSWLRIVQGPSEGIDLAGSMVGVTASGQTRWQQANRWYSYCSSSDPAVHFGFLEPALQLDAVLVDQIDGRRILYRGFRVGATYSVP